MLSLIIAVPSVIIKKIKSEKIYYNRIVDSQKNKFQSQKNKIELLETEIQLLNHRIENLSKKYSWKVTLTGYTNAQDECNSDNWNTAIMEKPVVGWTVAVSQDLKCLLGKRIYVEGFGVRYVNDLMNKRFTNSIDILVATKKQAIKKIGKRTNVEIVLLE